MGPSLIDQLRALAGAAPEAARFAFVHRGRRLHVEYEGGSAQRLSIDADWTAEGSPAAAPAPSAQGGYRAANAPVLRAPRPLELVLSRETDETRASKKRGVLREVQTGDPAFDARVFVDCSAPDEVVLALLAPPEVRAGVLALLELDVTWLAVDHDGLLPGEPLRASTVHARFTGLARRATPPDEALRLADALASIAAALPWVLSAGAARAPLVNRVGEGLIIASFLGVVGALGVYGHRMPAACTPPSADGAGTTLSCGASPRCCRPALYGLLGGVPAALLLCALVHRLVRGRSDSTYARAGLMLGGSLLCLELGAVAAALWP